MRRRKKHQLSPTYGTPHPGIAEAQENALFAMSIYDAAPRHVRDRAKMDCQSDIQWFYGRESDPRPFDERYGTPPGYRGLPPFPWATPYDTFMSIFG